MSTLLHHTVDDAALARPEAPAVICDGSMLGYGDLVCRANGLARVLIESGLERRERVAVLLGKGLDVPVSFYGVLKAGGALVPIDPRSPIEHVVRILRATGARHLVTEPSKQPITEQILAACPEIGTVVGLAREADVECSCVPWDAVAAEAGERQPAVEILDLDSAYILHTSGSTGTPKLIRHTHRSAMSFVDWAAAEYSLRPEDRLSNHSSHHTCFATFDYYAAARAGAATVIVTPAALMMPASLSALLERERVSVWYSVPTALVHLSLRGGLEERDLSPLRWVLFAGETFPPKHLRQLMRQLPQTRFSHVYGSTEVNVCTYFHLPKPDAIGSSLPIGRPCSTSETLVVDNQLEPVASGEVGELLVRGSTVMTGYWGDPEANQRALVRRSAAGGFDDIYFRTGDRVRVLDDGNLAFVNRADFQVKIRGHRVELEEVEEALLKLDMVEEAAAFTKEDGEGSSTLCAAVVPATGRLGTPSDLHAGLHDLLPPYAVPEKISTLPAMPRTPTGKVDRDALREASDPAREEGSDG